MMKNKLLYVCILAIFSAGFYSLGSYTHQSVPTPAVNIQEESTYGPDFSQDQPYLPFVYGPCPMNDIPDEQSCITKLADSTLAEADILENKLLQTSPEKNVEKNEGYYEALRSAVQSAQNTRDNHINAYCNLDGMRI
jgi:hypothetical protein